MVLKQYFTIWRLFCHLHKLINKIQFIYPKCILFSCYEINDLARSLFDVVCSFDRQKVDITHIAAEPINVIISKMSKQKGCQSSLLVSGSELTAYLQHAAKRSLLNFEC